VAVAELCSDLSREDDVRIASRFVRRLQSPAHLVAKWGLLETMPRLDVDDARQHFASGRHQFWRDRQLGIPSDRNSEIF